MLSLKKKALLLILEKKLRYFFSDSNSYYIFYTCEVYVFLFQLDKGYKGMWSLSTERTLNDIY